MGPRGEQDGSNIYFTFENKKDSADKSIKNGALSNTEKETGKNDASKFSNPPPYYPPPPPPTQST